MSDQARTKRTNTLTDTGYSVQDRLKLWKQRDATSAASLSPSKPGSLVNPTTAPLSPHSSNKGSMSPLATASSSASVTASDPSSSSSKKGPVTSLDILSELELETEEVVPSPPVVTTSTYNNKTPSPSKSPAQLSPSKPKAAAATTSSTIVNSDGDSATTTTTSSTNENDVFFKFINKLQTEPEKARKPSAASSSSSSIHNNDLNVAIPILPLSSTSSSSSSSPTHPALPSLSVLKARSSAAHSSAANSTKSTQSAASEHHRSSNNTVNNHHSHHSSPIHGTHSQSHSHSPPHSGHTSLSHSAHSRTSNSCTGSIRSPCAHDGTTGGGVDKETIDRIIATVDRLHLPEQLKIQQLARHNCGKLGNHSSSSGSSNGKMMSGSAQQLSKEDASRRGRAASPAVERLITSIDQFKEMENLQKNIERLRAERVKKTTT